jgi:hypothetical protein
MNVATGGFRGDAGRDVTFPFVLGDSEDRFLSGERSHITS